MIEDALVALITADPGFTDLCADRLSPSILPDPATYPAVSFRRISRQRSYTLDGTSMAVARFQLDCWGETQADACDVADALEQLRDGYSGSVAGTDIALITAEDGPAGFDQNQRAFYVQTDWVLTYSPA